MNEVKSLLGTRSDEESGDFDVASVCPSLSYKQVSCFYYFHMNHLFKFILL